MYGGNCTRFSLNPENLEIWEYTWKSWKKWYETLKYWVGTKSFPRTPDLLGMNIIFRNFLASLAWLCLAFSPYFVWYLLFLCTYLYIILAKAMNILLYKECKDSSKIFFRIFFWKRCLRNNHLLWWNYFDISTKMLRKVETYFEFKNAIVSEP